MSTGAASFLLAKDLPALLRIYPCHSCRVKHQRKGKAMFFVRLPLSAPKTPLDYPERKKYTEYCIQNTVFRMKSQVSTGFHRNFQKSDEISAVIA
jgi:hypothetical protein